MEMNEGRFFLPFSNLNPLSLLQRLILEQAVKKFTNLNEFNVREPLVESILQSSKEMSLYNLL